MGVCDRFTEVEADTYEERVAEACTGCGTCEGRAPLQKSDSISKSDADRMLAQTSQLLDDYRAGLITRDELTLFEETLISHWIALEHESETFVSAKLSAFIDSFAKQK